MLALYHVNHSTVHAAIIELSSCKLLTVEYLVASPSLAGLTLHYMVAAVLGPFRCRLHAANCLGVTRANGGRGPHGRHVSSIAPRAFYL